MVHTILCFIGCVALSVVLYKDIKYLANHLWE